MLPAKEQLNIQAIGQTLSALFKTFVFQRSKRCVKVDFHCNQQFNYMQIFYL